MQALLQNRESFKVRSGAFEGPEPKLAPAPVEKYKKNCFIVISHEIIMKVTVT